MYIHTCTYIANFYIGLLMKLIDKTALYYSVHMCIYMYVCVCAWVCMTVCVCTCIILLCPVLCAHMYDPCICADQPLFQI